jgi:putative acetyltransferase
MVTITQECPDSPDAVKLIYELDKYLTPLYLPESQHGLDVQELIREKVAFFILRVDGKAAGCGGVKIVSDKYAEIKRLYVQPGFQGRGFGKLILTHLEDYADRQGTEVIRLETGVS